MPRPKNHTVVLYDISHDRARTKVSDACLNFGLTRFQFSAFEGGLSRNRREELALLLQKLIADVGGRLRIFPICGDDLSSTINIEIEPPPLSRIAGSSDGKPCPRLAIFTGDEAT